MNKYILTLYIFLFQCLLLTSCLTAYAFNSSCDLEEVTIDTYETCELENLQYDIKQLEEINGGENNVEEIIEEEIISESISNNRWEIELTEDEVNLLARIVMLEAGGESGKGQQAVVEVVLNRMYHEEFPDTLHKVLSQSGQFATWKNRNIKAATPTDKVYENINAVLTGETNILPYETVYFGTSAQNERKQVTIGNHVFCNY